MMHLRYSALAVAGLLAAVAPTVASAQADSLLVNPFVPVGYDRGRNVSVAERPRPDYDPLGVRTGAFLIFPQIDLGLGASSNIYLSEGDTTGAGYLVASPSIRATSDWSRHQLTGSAGGTFRRFFGEPRRNEDSWRTALLGRADLGSRYAVTGEFQAGKVYETPFSGEVDSNFAALSSYNYVQLGARGQVTEGRFRGVLGYSFNEFDFNPIQVDDRSELDQSTRDRTINTVTGQGEYALSPSVSVYGQMSYNRTEYDRPLAPTIPSQSSNGYRALAGLSIDLPAFIRGTIAAGYTVRDYNADRYGTVSGLSAEGRLEYFFSEVTTFTVGLRRVIADSQLAETAAFFDNRVTGRVDHELLRNLILTGSAEYAYQDYVDTDRANKVYRVGAGARLLLSRQLAVNLGVSHSARDRSGENYNGTLNETRGELSISFRR